ncbi:MAG: hypothetical protein LBG99_00800 [Propionibacteriaceae bacterium]|jgi:hypothetical protein|nr:hypothetical protein [Propionibacteriaceae bacterium]
MKDSDEPMKSISLQRIALSVMLLVVMYIIYLMVFETYVLRSLIFMGGLVGFVGCLAVLLWAVHKISIKPWHFIIGIIVLSFSTKLAFVLAVQTQPISDFRLMYETAIQVAAGDPSGLGSYYFQMWAYQTGFVAWMAFFVHFFGAGVTFFKVLNCVYLTATNLVVYLFCRKVASEKAAQVTAILFCFFPSTYFLITVLSGQHLSNLLIMTGVYVYFIKKKTRTGKIAIAVTAGILIALGGAIRPIAIVAIAALIVFELLVFLKKSIKARRILVKSLATVMITIVSYFGVSSGLSKAVQLSGLNEFGLTNNCPEWKFVLGFNPTTSGQYSEADAGLIFSHSTSEERREAAFEVIEERLSVPPSQLINLFRAKINIMWANPDPTWWAFGHMQSTVELPVVGEVHHTVTMQRTGLVYYCGIFVLVGLGVIRAIRRNDLGIPLLMALIFLAYFTIHIFIEIQTRYRDFALIPAFVLAGVGIAVLYEKVIPGSVGWVKRVLPKREKDSAEV